MFLTRSLSPWRVFISTIPFGCTLTLLQSSIVKLQSAAASLISGRSAKPFSVSSLWDFISLNFFVIVLTCAEKHNRIAAAFGYHQAIQRSKNDYIRQRQQLIKTLNRWFREGIDLAASRAANKSPSCLELLAHLDLAAPAAQADRAAPSACDVTVM
jgi:hypothetical protein